MSKLRIVGAGLLAVFLLLTLLDRFVIVTGLALRIGLPLLAALAEAIAIVGAGFAVRGLRGRVWRVHDDAAKLDLALDFVIGYPIFGALCFVIATVRVATWTMTPLMVLCGLLGGYAILRHREVHGGQAILPVRADATADRHCLSSIAIAVVFLCAFISAQAPPFSLDELTYHLAIPKAWLLEGRAVELPLLSHSYFPLGTESADLPLLALLGNDGGIASHLLHLLAALAVTLLIQRRVRNMLITAAIVTTPALAISAGWSLADWPLAGSCVALWIALEDEDDATAAAAIGAGLLTKYTFIPFAIVALAVARKWRPALPGLAIGCVFFIRNLILTGNPLAPFFAAAAPHVGHYRGAAYLADYVFDAHFIDEALGASLLALLPLASGAIPLALLLAGVAFFLLAPSARLLAPFFVVPAMSAEPRVRGRRWLEWLLAIAIGAQTLFVVYYTDVTRAFPLLAGEPEEAFLARQRPSYPSIAALNPFLPAGSRTLVIGTGETFWFAERVRGGGNFDSERISRYLEAPTPEALRERLRSDGITHVAIIGNTAAPTSVAQKIEERQTRLTPAAQRMLAQLLDRYAASVTPRGDATLFVFK
jgi:hypothetical protein